MSSGLRCGISDAAVEVPAILRKSEGCLSCLAGDVKKELKRCPGDEALQLVGMYAAYRIKDFPAATSYYESLNSGGKLDAGQHADAGYIYQKMGNTKDAIDAFRLAIAGGADPFVQFELAKLLHADNRDAEASEILERILKENPVAPSQNGVTVIGYGAVRDEALQLLSQIHAEQRTGR